MRPPPATDFDAFAVRHLRRLVQVADLLTGDRVEADRVVVDAFVVLSRTWPSRVDSQAQLGAARRCLAVAARRSPRWRGSTGQEAALELADEFGAAAETPEGADAVWQAVLDLAPRDRMVLVWHLFEQLPASAVAQAVGAPALVVGRRVRRGLDQVGMTVGLAAEDEIAGRRDASGRDRVATQVAACLEQHHRGEADVEPLLARIRTGTAGISPRRSRTRPALLAAAAAGLVLVLVLASVVAVRWWPDQPDARAVLPTLPSFPVAPPGTRLVGYGDVAVAVPTDWEHNAVSCGSEGPDTVIYPDAAVEGRCATSPGASSITFADPPPYPSPYRAAPVEVGEVGDRVVLGTAVSRTDAGYEQTLLVPVSGFSMVVRSPDRSVVVEVAASMRVVPDGFTVVPPCRGQRLRDAAADLADARLKLVVDQASTLSDNRGQPPVTFQNVDSGQLVPIGSRIELFVPSF